MIAKAMGRFIRFSPRKVRQIIDLIRGKDVTEALSILSVINKGSRQYIKKLLESAINNAKTQGFQVNKLYISKITGDIGPMWKRYKASAFGRASKIKRRTSHIKIELDVK
jgi:large subunit ribosomal protein L22